MTSAKPKEEGTIQVLERVSVNQLLTTMWSPHLPSPPFINRPKGCNLFSIWTQLFADIDIQLLSLQVIGLIMCM